MAADPSLRDLNDCGCCEGTAVRTPVEVYNRPGLKAIAYRVGTHARFKQTMLARLSTSELPALSGLGTRADDDFAIALLDAWATVADVLTFYQERVANESYLRTATERLSLVHLARLIGYEPRPGVAAHTLLAFTLDDAPGSPDRVMIDVGTKVQSIPGPGELPQTFETVEQIEARAEWNAIRPRAGTPQVLSTAMGWLWLEGENPNVRPGDMLLIVALNPTRREVTEWAPYRIGSIDPPLRHHTRLTLEPSGPEQPTSAPETSGVWALRVKAALFGHNAPLIRTTVNRESHMLEFGDSWALDEPANPEGLKILTLDAVYDHIQQGSWVVIDRPNTTPPGGRRQIICKVTGVQTLSRAAYGIAGRVTQLKLDTEWRGATEDFSLLRQTVVFTQSEPLTNGSILTPESTRAPSMLRTNPVWNRSIELIFGSRPNEGLKEGQPVLISGEVRTTREGLGGEGAHGSELAFVERIMQGNNTTTLILKRNLANIYWLDSVAINANVAHATHGETVHEVLGSGDASQAFQRFFLRQPPLTYVNTQTPSGAESTLQVRVNDVLWREVPTLYGQGPHDRVFVTRTENDGRTSVEFGDGQTGARLPTEQENVRATYRKGNGLTGLVKADQLSMLLTRPLGVRAVTNPVAATEAADGEALDSMRQNAPLTVRTLDRVVSLQDYEDFARAFAGISKALATWTWTGQVRGVFVTIAGQRSDAIVTDGDLSRDLLAAMRQMGDPYLPLRVQLYRSATFQLAGGVKVHPDYLSERVLAAVRQALAALFSFDARALGQPVALSEVVAVMQAVPGVVAVDLDQLYRTNEPAERHPRLRAAVPQAGADGTVLAAELLTLDLDSLERVRVMS